MNSIMKVQNLHCLNDVHLFKYVYCLHMVDCVGCFFFFFFFLCVCVLRGGGGRRLGIFPMEGQGGGSCQSNAAKFSSLC